MRNFIKRLKACLILMFVFTGILGTAAFAAGKPLVVCSLFPQYDFARQVAGERATVFMLLPPGMESHTFDPRPADIITLNKANLFVFTGAYMEPWAKRIVESLDNKKLIVVDASAGINLLREHDGVQHGHDVEYDPHIWLDFTLAAKIVDAVADGLCRVDPENAFFYKKNASDYKTKLAQLDRDFFEIVKNGKRDTLVFGGRFAYRYFLAHYNLKYVTAYETCSTEGEPSVRQMANVIRYIKDNGVRVLFHEEFVDPKVARSIAEQTEAESLLFSTGHNVTKDEFQSGITFIDIMRANMKNVEKGLR